MKTKQNTDGVEEVVREDKLSSTKTKVILPRFTIPDFPIRWLNPILQGFFTLLHGIARPGDKPLMKHTNVTEILRRLVAYALGMLLMGGIVLHWNDILESLQGLPLPTQALAWIFLGYVIVMTEFILLSGRVRTLVTTIVHEATHGKLLKNRKHGDLLAEWITILLGVQPFYLYKPEHLGHHDGRSFATMVDADARMLVELLGFKPGQPPSFYWRQLVKAILIPKVAFYWNLARLRQNLLLLPDEDLRWRLVAAWLFFLLRFTIVIGGSLFSGSIIPVILYVTLWGLPVWILYPLSMTIQACSEHTWLALRKPGEGAKLFLYRRLLNRFPFTPWTGIKNIAPFLFKVATHDIFVRGFILGGSLPLHGRHHTTPAESVELWPLERYRAAEEYARGEVAVPTYTSLLKAMASVFTALSTLPPLTAEDKPAYHRELEGLSLGM